MQLSGPHVVYNATKDQLKALTVIPLLGYRLVHLQDQLFDNATGCEPSPAVAEILRNLTAVYFGPRWDECR